MTKTKSTNEFLEKIRKQQDDGESQIGVAYDFHGQLKKTLD
jgi:hypothetical protein